MIIDTTIDGKPCQLIYVDDDFQPVGEDEATMVKVIFEDGTTMFVDPARITAEDSDAQLG